MLAEIVIPKQIPTSAIGGSRLQKPRISAGPFEALTCRTSLIIYTHFLTRCNLKVVIRRDSDARHCRR